MPFRRETLLQSVPLLRRAPDEDRKNLDVHDSLPGWKSSEVIV